MRSSAKLAAIAVPEFDLQGTIECGQIFHAMPLRAGWQVLVDRTALYVEQKGGEFHVEERHRALATHYFALDHPLEAIYAAFPSDPFSKAALDSCRGLRIIRQPYWECLATFITSPMKQVSHIRQISLQLRERYGEPVKGSLINAYPSPSRLASLTETDLRDCGLGFRAKSLLGTARAIASNQIDLKEMATLPTEKLRADLCRLPGVGRKVANCVLLFAYERLAAVPVDVWIARILQAMRKRRSTLRELEDFSQRRFGPYAGYIQQYLFHYARMSRTLP